MLLYVVISSLYDRPSTNIKRKEIVTAKRKRIDLLEFELMYLHVHESANNHELFERLEDI